MRPVVELKGRIMQVRTVRQGRDVGYGAAWTGDAAEPHRDGGGRICRRLCCARPAPPRASRRAEAIVAGKRCPVVGRMSMDLLAIDVTDLPDGQCRRGDFVTLIGGGIGVDELGAAAGTIGYEMLTSLGRRYHRIYKGA